MALKFFLTLVSLAILHASFDTLPVAALSVERGHLGRDLSHAHAEIARGQSLSKKCRPRPTSASQSPVASTAPNSAALSKPTSTTSSSQPAPTNAPASSISSKVMFAWSNFEQPSIPNFTKGHPRRLIYNWHMTKYSDINIDTLNVEFVPTIASAADAANCQNVLKAGYANYVKTFNEPEIPGQANLSPQAAHQLWMQYIEGLTNRGYNLLAPSVTGAGYDWMKTFLSLCNGQCSIHGHDFHFYGLQVEDFKNTVNKFHDLDASKPMWLSEVGCHDYSGGNQPCTQDVFNSLFSGVMSFVETTGFINQIAWFGMFKPSEMPMGVEGVNAMITCPTGNNADCQPNGLGSQYLGY